MPCALPGAHSELAAKSEVTRLRGLSDALVLPRAFVPKAAPSWPGRGIIGSDRYQSVTCPAASTPLENQANSGARSVHIGCAALKITVV